LKNKEQTMSELKTQPTERSVQAFLDAIPEQGRRQDCYTILQMYLFPCS
jgi:hypothetical protein